MSLDTLPAVINKLDKNMKTSADRLVLLVSDSHLPLDNRSGAQGQINEFIGLLSHYREQMSSLILLGDNFDFWYEWKHTIPKRAYPVLKLLDDLINQGVSCHYFAGNHDFKLLGFLNKEVGLNIHMNEWKTVFDGKQYYFHHGDGMADSDVNYRKMKKVFRSRWAQKLFGTFIHPDLAMEAGRLTSESGRYRHRKNLKANPPQKEYIAKAQSIIRQGNDVVVFGHTHLPCSIELEGGLYHNPGPFLAQKSYSIIAGGLPQPEVWE